MKEHLKNILDPLDSQLKRRCLLREYLQARLLQVLQEKKLFVNWAFQGGTALRFLYALPRFSEDLDFALASGGTVTDFGKTVESITKVFEAENYVTELKVNERKTVKSAFVRFPGLLYELGLSSHETEAISIKVEVDTDPPAGAGFSSTVVRRHLMLNLYHYDMPSLLAGKLHAILARSYTKGRDYYDLIWYLSDRSWPEPNIAFLRNALAQTEWQGAEVTGDNWRRLIEERVADADWQKVVNDVDPFLERTEDAALLTLENLLSLLHEDVM